jgi:hypothetical protein
MKSTPRETLRRAPGARRFAQTRAVLKTLARKHIRGIRPTARKL